MLFGTHTAPCLGRSGTPSDVPKISGPAEGTLLLTLGRCFSTPLLAAPRSAPLWQEEPKLWPRLLAPASPPACPGRSPLCPGRPAEAPGRSERLIRAGAGKREGGPLLPVSRAQLEGPFNFKTHQHPKAKLILDSASSGSLLRP